MASGSTNKNTTASTPISSLNGENVDYNTTVNPYQKPTTQLNPGDKGDGVKWLQWILIYTECGLQGSITGEYDDATAAAVKNLQLKYGMTVDGIATTEVIEKAELMYNEYINGISNSTPNAPVVFNTAANTTTNIYTPVIKDYISDHIDSFKEYKKLCVTTYSYVLNNLVGNVG